MPRSNPVAGRRAHVLRAAAGVVIAIGYIDLIRGGVVVAPLALVSGYLVLVPLSFLTD